VLPEFVQSCKLVMGVTSTHVLCVADHESGTVDLYYTAVSVLSVGSSDLMWIVKGLYEIQRLLITPNYGRQSI